VRQVVAWGWLALAFVTTWAGCGDDGPTRTAYFDLAGSIATPATFWNLPFPSDLRLDASGAPDLTGFPNKRNVPILTSLMSVIPERRGFPVMPTAYVRFTAPVPARAITDVVADGSVLLVDIDPASTEVGATFAVVAATLPKDDYVPSDLVALAPRPGTVLRPSTRYAYVVLRTFAPGFASPAAFAELAAGRAPSGSRGAAAKTLYAPLWPALDAAGIARGDVLVATVFTTGDEVARTRARSEAIRAAYHPMITQFTLDSSSAHDGFCVITSSITLPQFQIGTPPFDSDGRFQLDASDVPARQTDMTIPLRLTIPNRTMPAAGWPLYQFFHGSGGVSSGLVDLGPSPDSGDHPIPGYGPGYVVALHGIAAASSALPLNPERLSGATDYAYLNINNLAAFPYTFQQGVFEQRLLLDALLAFQFPGTAVAAMCPQVQLPSGQTMHHFDPAKLVAGGQSMGGMYTNMIGAVEPRFGALVPTGAGGFWNLMILETATIPGARAILATALGVDDNEISFAHPAMNLMALAWEIAEPMASMARVSRRPLPGATVRHVYEPAGKGDTYFPIDVYDAAALAYGNQEAGTAVWPSMQDALATDGLGGLLAYPVRGNHDGHTRVVVQFDGDGILDPHYLYRQLDTVKHQYGCFLESYLRDGVPTVPAPGGLMDPCP
jgi:hypothetical protein